MSALARSGTLDGERATHLLRGQRAAVQAIAVAPFPGRKSMPENAREILNWNSHPVINDTDFDPIVGMGQAKKGTLDELQGQYRDAQAAITRLSSDIATRQRHLQTRRAELENLRQNAELQEMKQSRQAILGLFAPLLDAAVK